MKFELRQTGWVSICPAKLYLWSNNLNSSLWDGNGRVFRLLWNTTSGERYHLQQAVGQWYCLYEIYSVSYFFTRICVIIIFRLSANLHSASPCISSVVWVVYKVLHYFSVNVRWVPIISNYNYINKRITVKY